MKQEVWFVMQSFYLFYSEHQFRWSNLGATKQSNAVTSNEYRTNEKTSNGIKIQEAKKNPNERKNIKMVVIS